MTQRVQDLQIRTKTFALDIIRLFSSLPKTSEAQVLGRQLLRSGTSAGAHYREARRARSNAKFISKVEGGLQELEEAMYWLELLVESDIVTTDNVLGLRREAEELLAMMVASVKTAKARR